VLDADLRSFCAHELEMCVNMGRKTPFLWVTAHFSVEEVINCDPVHGQVLIYKTLILLLEVTDCITGTYKKCSVSVELPHSELHVSWRLVGYAQNFHACRSSSVVCCSSYSSLTAITYAVLLKWFSKCKSSGFRLRDRAGLAIDTHRSDICDPKTFDMAVLHTAHVQPAVLSCSETSIVLRQWTFFRASCCALGRQNIACLLRVRVMSLQVYSSCLALCLSCKRRDQTAPRRPESNMLLPRHSGNRVLVIFSQHSRYVRLDVVCPGRNSLSPHGSVETSVKLCSSEVPVLSKCGQQSSPLHGA